MKPTRPSYPRVVVMALAVAVAAIPIGEANANTGTKNGSTVETTASTRAPTSRLNLLSEPRDGQPAVRVRSMGAGSWICSPAGFGQRSRCYRN